MITYMHAESMCTHVLQGRGFNAIVIRPSSKSSVAAAAKMLREGKLTWSRPAGGINVAMPRFNVTTLAGLRRCDARHAPPPHRVS